MNYESWRATFQSSEQAARAAFKEWQAACDSNSIPETSLKMAGMIDLYDEEEPENKDVVNFGLLLEFSSREAMAASLDRGACKFSFGFDLTRRMERPGNE